MQEGKNMNKLYFGDNLEIMKDLLKKHPDGFIDLIYIDPPFNSKRNYNILFENIDMEDTKAQKLAFADTWSNVSYLDTIEEIKEIDMNLANFLSALDNINISKSAISYLATMSIRIWYMHKLLKKTGSFYLHCDPTMSHYLKIVCDLIFGEKNFRNEIVWNYKRYTAASNKFQSLHDIIHFYSKSDNIYFNTIRIPYGSKSGMADSHYKQDENGKWFRMQKRKDTKAYKVYLSEGRRLGDTWDISIINASAKERLGYPTQKPEALLERIVKASSNERDLVADFFCGCGTAVAVAEKLKRKWIGVDISHLAVKLIAKRLMDAYGSDIRQEFEISGFPQDIDSARSLAEDTRKGRLKFEEWIIEVMLHGVLNEKKNQTGFDGFLTLDFGTKKEFVLIEVKSGNAALTQVNHFIQTIKDRNGAMGIFVCFAEQVTDGMRQAVKKQGYLMQQHFGSRFPKVQIITVQDMLNDKQPALPGVENITFKKAGKSKEENIEQELEM